MPLPRREMRQQRLLQAQLSGGCLEGVHVRRLRRYVCLPERQRGLLQERLLCGELSGRQVRRQWVWRHVQVSCGIHMRQWRLFGQSLQPRMRLRPGVLRRPVRGLNVRQRFVQVRLRLLSPRQLVRGRPMRAGGGGALVFSVATLPGCRCAPALRQRPAGQPSRTRSPGWCGTPKLAPALTAPRFQRLPR